MNLNPKKINKSDKQISEELQGSYGRAIIIMTSNPEELHILCDKLKDDYEVIMDTEILDNMDYAKVIKRKD